MPMKADCICRGNMQNGPGFSTPDADLVNTGDLQAAMASFFCLSLISEVGLLSICGSSLRTLTEYRLLKGI